MSLSLRLRWKIAAFLHNLLSCLVLCGWELQVLGQQSSEQRRVNASVCPVCVSVCVFAWPPSSCPGPHPTAPACAPPPPLAKLGALGGCCAQSASSALGDPRRAWVQRPRAQLQPSGGRGGEGVVREPEKPEPTAAAAVRRDGQRALKFVTAAANSWREQGPSK